MKRIMKMVMFVSLLAVMALNTGCLSYMTYKGSEKRVAYKRALARNDQNAIRFFATGRGDEVIMALDVTAMDVIMERPGMQLLAGVGDGALAYGSYLGIEALKGDKKDNGDSGESSANNTEGNRNNTVNVINNGGNGDNGNINTSITINSGDANGGSGGSGDNSGDTSTTTTDNNHDNNNNNGN